MPTKQSQEYIIWDEILSGNRIRPKKKKEKKKKSVYLERRTEAKGDYGLKRCAYVLGQSLCLRSVLNVDVKIGLFPHHSFEILQSNAAGNQEIILPHLLAESARIRDKTL